MRPPHAALTLLCASLALLPGCESGGGTVGAGSGFGDGGSSDAATSSGGGISEPGPGLAPADVPQEDSPGNATADDQDAGPDAAGGDPGSDASDPAGAAPGPCEGLDIRIIRNVTWPSGGSELTLRVVDHSTGAPRADDVGGCFALTGSSTLGQAVLRVALPAEHLVLTLSSPVQGESPAALAEAVTAFIQGRPAGERIALFGWGASLEQLAGYTTDRDWLRRQAERWFARPHPSQPEAGPSGIAELLDEYASVGGDGPRGMRAVVVFGAAASAVGTGGVGASDGVAVRVAAPAGDHPAAALEDISDTLATLSEQGFYNIGVCHDPGGQSAVLAPTSQIVALGETRVGERGVASVGCDAAIIASGTRPYPRHIAFEFSDAQVEVYKERLKAASKDDFGVSVRLWPDGDLVPAVAHLRGRGSLGCERRNYTLNLDGPSHHLIPGSATDEFYLVSMCLDDRYVNQLLGDGLMAHLGVFPIQYRLVELSLPSGSKGVYLLMEKVAEALVEGHTGVEAVIRRGTDIDGKSDEVKFAVGGEAEAMAAYHAFRDGAEAHAGADLVAWLEDRLALDDYLRWVAFNTLVRNGDYIDEMWLYASLSQAAGGAQIARYEVMGWDPDDLFSACHYEGGYAIEQPQGLLYCTESILDHAIFDDAPVFERYVDQLEQILLVDADEAAVADAAAWIRARLLPFLEDPTVAAAMKELVAKVPAATDPAVAIAEVDGKLSSLQGKIESRRDELLAAIATWRETGP